MPAEPEKYSIDEMMDRLKNHSSEEPLEEGELVTRADGSQALRVRKRKRRSHQPHKEQERLQRRIRVIQVSAALFLFLLIGSMIGSILIYTNSAPFRLRVVQMITESSEAKVALEQFRVSLTRANAGRVTLTWPEGNSIQELSMLGATAAINPSSYFGKSFTGEEIAVTDATLKLPILQSDQAPESTPSAPSFKSFHFDRYAIARLQLIIGDAAQPLIHLKESEAMFRTSSETSRPQLLLNHGNVSMRGWQNMKLDRSLIEFRGSEIDVISMRLLHESDIRGSLDLNGTIFPNHSGKTSSLALRLNNFLLSGIVGPELGEIISGRVQTVESPNSNQLTYSPNSDSPLKLDASFTSSPSHTIEVGGFPFLASLARLLDDDWFERPVFDIEAAGTLRRNGQTVFLENLNLESKDRMLLRGNISVAADKRLSGQLEVGIAEAMVRAAFNRRVDAMTRPEEEGYRWLTLKIGGHVKNPSDDFLELLENAKMKTVPEPEKTDGVPSFEELIAPE